MPLEDISKVSYEFLLTRICYDSGNKEGTGIHFDITEHELY